jgi:Rod binding domain-containing protein
MHTADRVSLLDSTASLAAGAPPGKLAGAAQQFEALLIGEMLKSSSNAWLDSDADSGAESAMGMAQTQFAQALAAGGGFGLAKTIEKSIAAQTGTAPASSAQNENAVPDIASPASLK